MPAIKANRRNVPLFLVWPPDERGRLERFADTVGRPMSWVVRDAVRVYLDALEKDVARMVTPKLDLGNAGRTVQGKRGRPRKVET